MLKKLLGDPNARKIKKLQPLVAEINLLEEDIQQLSDEDLKRKTVEFREELDKAKNNDELADILDEILPEAFAVVREAGIRVLGMRHFDVQLMGGVILHQGQIAEMKTGEGKTLVATLPLFLNALAGRGSHLITTNDYLARRDAEWMAKRNCAAIRVDFGVIEIECLHVTQDNRRKSFVDFEEINIADRHASASE